MLSPLSCSSILKYRPQVQCLDLNSLPPSLLGLDVQADHFCSAHVPLKYFSLFKLKRNEYAGLFFFAADSAIPRFFCIAKLNYYGGETSIDANEEKLYLLNCRPASVFLSDGKLELGPSSAIEKDVLRTAKYCAAIFPSFLWKSVPSYFSRILISTPRPATMYLPDLVIADRFQEVLLEKIRSLLISRDAPPVFKGEILEISHHLKTYQVEVLSILPNCMALTASHCNYSKDLQKELVMLLEFINTNGLFFYSFPKSVVIFEQEPNLQNLPYAKGDACIASGVSRDSFAAFLNSIKLALFADNPIGLKTKVFCIEGHPGSGKRLLLRNLVKELPIPFVVSVNCTSWTALEELDDVNKSLESVLKQVIANTPSIVKMVNFSPKVNSNILVCFREKFVEKIQKIPGAILLFIGGFSDFDILTRDGTVVDTLSCCQLATYSQRLSICENLLAPRKKEIVCKYLAGKTHGYLYKDLCKVIELAFGSYCGQGLSNGTLAEEFSSLSIDACCDLSKIDEALRHIPPSLSHEV